ncbi:MAG: hypothetical protein U0Y82_07000 [Thermoleophilia bacterium]
MSTQPLHIPVAHLPDVRLIGRAGIISVAHHIVTIRSTPMEQAEQMRRLRLAHRVWLRATGTDDYDVESWESFYHHPEYPTWTDLRELLVAMSDGEPGWRSGIDLVTAVQRVTAASPLR